MCGSIAHAMQMERLHWGSNPAFSLTTGFAIEPELLQGFILLMGALSLTCQVDVSAKLASALMLALILLVNAFEQAQGLAIQCICIWCCCQDLPVLALLSWLWRLQLLLRPDMKPKGYLSMLRWTAAGSNRGLSASARSGHHPVAAAPAAVKPRREAKREPVNIPSDVLQQIEILASLPLGGVRHLQPARPGALCAIDLMCKSELHKVPHWHA